MYIAYKKANEGPVFSTVLLLSISLTLYIFFFIMAFCWQFFNISETGFILIFIVIHILTIVIIARKYNTKKINELLIKYRYHKCNKWLKNWMIYVGFVLIFPASPFFIPLWVYFFEFVHGLFIN
jgi:hypothetical protein